MSNRILSKTLFFTLMTALVLSGAVAFADGTEQLNPIELDPDGTDLVGDGVGLEDGAETVTFTVPPGTTVEQVLLYWNGFHTTETNGASQIDIRNTDGGGFQTVTGDLIGGATFFFGTVSGGDNWSSTYRQDITELGLVPGPGTYELEIAPFDGGFDQANNGASVIVIFNDPASSSKLRLADGQDLAFINFGGDLQVTQPVTFTFPAAAFPRPLEMTLLAGSVQGPTSGSDPIRPNRVDVTTDGPGLDPVTTELMDPFASFSGNEWDHVCNEDDVCNEVETPVLVIPAGADSVTIQAFSAPDGSGNLPASFAWLGTAIAIEERCDIAVDKQVSCDGGENWIDVGDVDEFCSGRDDGIPEIKVRYFADTNATADLFNCELTDSNGAILPLPVEVGMLPANGEGLPLFETDLLQCDGTLAGGEPNTATLTCTCFAEDSEDTVTDTDVGNIECVIPECGDGILDEGETCDPPDEPAGPNDNLCREDCTVCGDEIVNGDEQCDDGNTIDDDDCRNDCTIPVCGDRILDEGETCDPPDEPAGPNDNLCREDCTVCGDEIVNGDEQCDDGNAVDDDDCRNDCTIPVCGDRILDEGETCDPPDEPAGPNDNLCREDCTVCGDEIVNGDEQCDDGNAIDDDDCRNDCTIPVCGDRILDPGETCDPPDEPAGPNDNLCREDCTVCGDEIVNGDEQCDDGNAVDDDDCRNDCTIPECGDRILDEGETCDPPNEPAGPNDNLCREDCTVCGDEIVNGDEQCDDGNAVDDDDCRNDCTIPECGDRILDPGETCDPPDEPAGPNDNLCREDCTVCGDEIVNGDEQCDDGNNVDDDDCRNDCTIPECGDRILDPGETCDPPDEPAGPNDNLCREDCTVCGDEIVNGDEQCDDGNNVDDDDCRNDCTIPTCGDRILDEGETCDPPDEPAGPNDNLCREDCTVCGDEIVNGDEQCDDGNAVDGDDCRNDCTIPVCGDRILDEGETCDPPDEPAGPNDNLCREDCTVCGDEIVNGDEQCDDGNAVDGDDCRNDCTIPTCGDRIVDEDETCDPPDEPAGPNDNLCREDCTVCGDEIVNGDEQCDDGNNVDDDDCRNDCTIPVCGDRILDPGETCDPPNEPAGPNDNLCREDCTVCGDEIVNGDEQCDDGNAVNDDDCRNDCTIPTCGDRILDPGETCDPPDEPAGPNDNLCREDCTVCGDEIVNGDEQCDDGNAVDDDDCRNDCTIPVCGDRILDEGETCDPPDEPAGPNDNLCREDCTVCGDEIVNGDEQCDDGNTVDDDDCRNDCTIPECGDRILDEGETCDPPGEPAGEPDECREDCTYCGDEIVNGDEECDDGNNEDGDGCSATCVIEAMCELDVVKNCFVPQDGDDDDDDDDCNGKVLSMKLEYTGEGCAMLTNPQSGKATCEGNAGFASPVSIQVTDQRGSKLYADEAAVFLGDIIEASAANAGTDKFESQTDVTIDDGLESSSFHTSCSKPLQVGDQFGSMRLVELTTEGGTVTLPDPDPETPEGQKECVIPPPPAPPHCDGKVKGITLKYLGGSCDDTASGQDDSKVDCNGNAGGTQPVRITCFKDGGSVYLDTGHTASVGLGDLVNVLASNAGETSLASETTCEIYDEFGNWVQDLAFHTSCSQPLNLGDRFGSLEVFGLNTTGGGAVALAHEVIYTYKVSNLSDLAVENVTVIDDQLGEVSGSPIPILGPDEMTTLQALALISEDTTNVVEVTGTLINGQQCPVVTDSATVTVEELPDIVECTSKIKATRLQYTGPDLNGHVTVRLAGRDFENDPAVFEFPDGLVAGTVLMSEAENGYSVDAAAHGASDLGSRMSIWVNGAEEEHHTSCSTPYVANRPAPLNDPKGDPSPNWFVIGFAQK